MNFKDLAKQFKVKEKYIKRIAKYYGVVVKNQPQVAKFKYTLELIISNLKSKNDLQSEPNTSGVNPEDEGIINPAS